MYQESGLAKTLTSLTLQTVIKECEIIISEYNPDSSSFTRDVVTKFKQKYKIPIIHHIVDRPLISHARNEGVLQARGKYIVNFDGDARFNTSTAIKQLVKPLETETETGQYQLTLCTNELDLIGLSEEQLKKIIVPQQAFDQLNRTQDIGIPVFEPGSTFTVESFVSVGGFNEVKNGELMILGFRFMLKYPGQIKYPSPNVSVIVSPRRVMKLEELGLGILDYNNAIREDKVIQLK